MTQEFGLEAGQRYQVKYAIKQFYPHRPGHTSPADQMPWGVWRRGAGGLWTNVALCKSIEDAFLAVAKAYGS